jgi:histidinol-phosphatase
VLVDQPRPTNSPGNSPATPACDPRELAERFALAQTLASEAAELILTYYSPLGHRFEQKTDGSPVTIADLKTEELLRDRLARACPADGLLGEEFGDRPGRSGFRWVIDPIDGTRSFVHGVPLFGTMIGLEFRGERLAGVVHFPALGEQYAGCAGVGSTLRHRGVSGRSSEAVPLRCSRVGTLAEATIVTTDPAWMLRMPPVGFFAELCRRARVVRGWSDCYAFVMVAAGRADLAIDPPMKPWDVAALEPILREAGALSLDWSGGPAGDGSRGMVACTPGVWAEAARVISGAF